MASVAQYTLECNFSIYLSRSLKTNHARKDHSTPHSETISTDKTILANQSMIHQGAGCKRTATAYWAPAATAKVFETCSEEHHAALTTIKAANVRLKTVSLSHRLDAFLPALIAFQTSLAITNLLELPSTDHILDLVRNEVLCFVSLLSSTSVAPQAQSCCCLPHAPPARARTGSMTALVLRATSSASQGQG